MENKIIKTRSRKIVDGILAWFKQGQNYDSFYRDLAYKLCLGYNLENRNYPAFRAGMTIAKDRMGVNR